MSKNENTVDEKNQVKDTSTIRYYGNSKSNNRILVLGNSITRHEKRESIGWYNDYGMAASCEENDYVHVLMSLLMKNKMDFYMMVVQASSWEVSLNQNNVNLDNYIECQKFMPSIIVFRLGENIKDYVDKEIIHNELNKLIDYLRKECRVIYTTTFWKNDYINDIIKLQKNEHSKIVKIDDLGSDDKMKAIGLFNHPGVCAHPGDLGMKTIAERIYKAIIE